MAFPVDVPETPFAPRHSITSGKGDGRTRSGSAPARSPGGSASRRPRCAPGRWYGIGAQELSPGRTAVHRPGHHPAGAHAAAAPARRGARRRRPRSRWRASCCTVRAAGAGPASHPPRASTGRRASGSRCRAPRHDRGLARAALAMDGALMDEIIRAGLACDGVIRHLAGPAVPVLHRDRHPVRADRHLRRGRASAVLGDAGRTGHPASDAAGPADDRPVLLAWRGGEQHSLPLYALAAALAECTVSARMLGAALPYARWSPRSGAPGRLRCSSGRRSGAPGTRPACRTCGPGGLGPGCCSAAQAGRGTACRMAAA